MYSPQSDDHRFVTSDRRDADLRTSTLIRRDLTRYGTDELVPER
jgi:hypothetical protein